MSGKSYTMREMKMIVEYLVDNKLYGEIRARKMWMDFANSKLTSRTWQSLKETFLKRVLPDIHNPYYKLTIEQINSFRSGYDIEDRNKTKLEVHTISDDSNSNGKTGNDKQPTNNGNNHEGDTTAGENIKCSKIPPQNRSSADTVILESCYETAEDILKELESNDKDLPEGNDALPSSKSLRDCITYSEPLTPMLQEVLADFASEPEDSDREGTMQIVETVQVQNTENITQIPEPDGNIPNLKTLATDIVNNAKRLSTEVVEEVLAQELDSRNKPENTSPKKDTRTPKTEPENVSTNKKKDSLEESHDNTENGNFETTENKKQDNSENDKESVNGSINNEISVAKDSHSESMFASQNQNSHNSSTGTVDASLPNNPEGLKNKQSQNIDTKSKEIPESSKSSMEVSSKSGTSQNASTTGRKRSSSIETTEIEKKKKKLEVRLKAPLKVNKKGPKPDTQAGKMQDEKCEKAELKPSNKDKEEIMELDAIQETVTDKIVTEIEKPSTSHNIEEVNAPQNKETDESHNKNEPTEMKNPCLQNVSLFDEQFNKAKYNMSESSDTEQNKKETSENTQEGTSKATEVVQKVQTESETEQTRSPPKKKHRPGVLTSKSERDKAISNMFGHISGGVTSKRRRQLNRRSRTISHNNMSHNAPLSNSSEWTSESESDTFISPPRSRKNRHTRKYLKPRSAKILSLEEEGGLFVMYGKKIYPLIKDGKIVKNYLTYLPESDSDEGESYWKQKYEEEKRKAAELKKLLEEAKEPPAKEPNSPILPANPLRNAKSNYNQAQETSNASDKQICIPSTDDKKEVVKVNPPEKIMIKFTKNNEEVHLEGHWPQIHPVLEQVVQIFHKEVEPSVSDRQSRMMVEPPIPSKEHSSGGSTPIIITPIDPEIHEKVNKIEKEIFNEIEERDKEEETVPTAQETNVTKRKGRPRKTSSVTLSPTPQPKTLRQLASKKSLQNTTTNQQDATENAANNNKDITPKRQIKTPRKILNETVNINDTKTIQTRRSKQKLDLSSPEDNVKYMLRPKSLRLSKSPAKKAPYSKKQKSSKESSEKLPPPDISLNSIDSTQGYQDSDVSPVRTELRKKKMLHQSSFMIKTRNSLRRSSRRKSHPYLYCDAYNDSSNSSNNGPIEIVARENSSLNTDVYRSESYQLLMPQAKNSKSQLEPIDETSLINSNTYFVKHLDSMCNTEEALHHNNCNSHSSRGSNDVGSSSNISLPMSPELSVVENISISKDMLNSIDYYPTINEMQSNNVKEQTDCSKYMISDVDVSVPLMEQDCGLENCDVQQTGTSAVNSTDPKSVVTESLLNKIGTINIGEQITATDTLNQKLHDMLLESAKKIKNSNKESMMDVDDTNVETKKKAKAKKRCSTPRKRKVTKKSVAPTVEPVVEEHIELCSHSGRKSCPPFFQTLAADENVINEEIASLTIEDKKTKGKARKKKDIIRVKIQRPKSKKSDDKLKALAAQNTSKISVYTDSGINESGVFLPIDDSVDLIHNHSETCLHANDCVGDSVEFVDNSKSVITLNDTTKSADNLWNSQSDYDDAENISPDFFCNNAQDVKSFYTKKNTDNTSDTEYHSPPATEVSNNSLITEDLSDDIPPPSKPTKWYLFSDEETTNTNSNMVGQGSTMLSVGNFGSNLKQLFPIACAVPDLSTITEFSTETDSRKPTLDLDGLTGDDFNSRMFDSNF